MADSKDQHAKAKKMESLMCSLCLDVFEEATLLRCGHTFCRMCLERYNQCHAHHQQPEPKSLSMLCPLCRQETNLGAGGVAGLPSNVSLNHLVEEFNDTSNPLRKLYEDRPRCSQCWEKLEGQEEEAEDSGSYAVVFCCDCDLHLCERCLSSHKTFEKNIFKGHRVVSLKEMISGERSGAASKFEKCSEHTSEARDFYCVDCRAVVCHKCTIVKHNVRDHKIRERIEVESEIRGKIAGLVTRCESEKYDLEEFIREMEQERRSAKTSLQGMLNDIDRTFLELQRQLEERKAKLKSEVVEIEASCNEKLDSIKLVAQKMSSQVSTAQDILECRDGHSCLEGDALVSHELLLTELEELLDTTRNWITESQGTPRNATHKATRLTFHVQPVDISKIGRVVGKAWKLSKEVKLPYGEPMSGLAVLSPESVLVGYFDRSPDQFSLDGSRTPKKLVTTTRDVTVLSDGRIAAIPIKGCIKLFDADGKDTRTPFTTHKTNSEMMIDSDGEDQIYVAYWDKSPIQVFTPNGGDPIREIKVSSVPQQVHTTKSGRLIIRSCDGVMVLDKGGKEVTLTSSEDTYPAVDEYDNIYIASINAPSSTVTIKMYSLYGVLVETILDGVKIKIPAREWYYMKCPSQNAIVLCTAGMMYVFKNEFDEIE